MKILNNGNYEEWSADSFRNLINIIKDIESKCSEEDKIYKNKYRKNNYSCK